MFIIIHSLNKYFSISDWLKSFWLILDNHWNLEDVRDILNMTSNSKG